MRYSTLLKRAANGAFYRKLPPWKTVYSFYKRAKDKGIWESVMRSLVEKSRLQLGRNAHSSYSIIDSQSVKTTSPAESSGIDGGEKNKGA
ncbi:MAG: hypothetical protein ACYC2U_00415 [Candidatus Amoebophilus sp.]